MTSQRTLVAVAGLFLLTACGGSSPSGPAPAPRPSPSAAPGGQATGQVTNALDDRPLAGITVAGGGQSATTDADGLFRLESSAGGRQEYTLTGAGVVERRTGLTLPGPRAVLPLIPSSFDLAAFDQLARASGRLRRWRATPTLVMQTTVLSFTQASDNAFTAVDERLTAAETEELVAQLTGGFQELTAGRLGELAGVARETAEAGAHVTLPRPGAIVVTRQVGLTRATGYWGYGRWAGTASGEVTGGIVFLDRDFERSGSPYRRSLRLHELGHALGWDHVTARDSFMQAHARTLPNEWDRQAMAIAFQRPPGNRPPDVDPGDFSANTAGPSGGPTIWGPPLP